MKNKPNYIKAIEKVIKPMYSYSLGGVEEIPILFKEPTIEELKAIKAACSIEITMREAEERNGE